MGKAIDELKDSRTTNYCFLTVVSNGQHGKKVSLDSETKVAYTLGRLAAQSDIHLDHVSCSRSHASLDYAKAYATNDFGWHIQDLQSVHGTFLNGGKIAPQRRYLLLDGDEMSFGLCTDIYVFHNSVPPEKHPTSEQNTVIYDVSRNLRQAPSDDEKKKKKKVIDDPVASINKKFKLTPSIRNVHSCRFAHIMLKHVGNGCFADCIRKTRIDRTKEEAIKQIKDIRKKIRQDPAKFVDFVTEYSECPSWYNDGDLGSNWMIKMPKEFEDEGRTLEVGELSDIVETRLGVHVIKRLK